MSPAVRRNMRLHSLRPFLPFRQARNTLDHGYGQNNASLPIPAGREAPSFAQRSTRGPLPMPVRQTMTYVYASGAGEPEVLSLATGPVPAPKLDEVLIRVQAAGVNRPDVAQRQGSYPPPPPGASPILGLEV